MRTPSPPECGLDLAPPLADRFIMELAPLDYGPVLLRKPFGSRLTADTLPSGCPDGLDPTVGASPWQYPSFPTSCLCRVRHGRVPQPTRHYPRLWIHRPSSERSRDFNPPNQNAAQHTLRGLCHRETAPHRGSNLLGDLAFHIMRRIETGLGCPLIPGTGFISPIAAPGGLAGHRTVMVGTRCTSPPSALSTCY